MFSPFPSSRIRHTVPGSIRWRIIRMYIIDACSTIGSKVITRFTAGMTRELSVYFVRLARRKKFVRTKTGGFDREVNKIREQGTRDAERRCVACRASRTIINKVITGY